MAIYDYITKNLPRLNWNILPQLFEDEGVEFTEEVYNYLEETSGNTNWNLLKNWGIANREDAITVLWSIDLVSNATNIPAIDGEIKRLRTIFVGLEEETVESGEYYTLVSTPFKLRIDTAYDIIDLFLYDEIPESVPIFLMKMNDSSINENILVLMVGTIYYDLEHRIEGK